MALIDRITRLFRADIHDLLDRIEEPGVVLKQAVRDMEKELGQDERTIRQLEREEERLASRCREIETSLKDIEARLDVCFQSEKEDLARRLIKRRLEAESLQKQLVKKKNQIGDALSRHKTQFQENQARMEEIRQKAELFSQDEPHENFTEEAGFHSDVLVRDEDVEVAFLREKQIRSRS